jgi:acyl transferase domain-containing protein/NAD(P)-dependent dehydrogenase (short-subunit alcohol dehydrogenase family)
VRVTTPAEFSVAAVGSAATTVVHLASLNWDSDEADEASAVLSAARTAAACGESTTEVRLLVATRGGQAVAVAERPVPAQAAVAAVAVVAGQEYMNLDATDVDLDPAQGPETAAQALAAELRRPSGTAVSVAYRAGRRFVPGYASAETGGQPTPPVRPGGAYLLTGGLSDVGLTLAGHLARGGAARLILAGRGGAPQNPGSPRAAAIRRLRELGADVLTPALDVTDPAALGALFAEHDVDGVVHLAADTSESTFVPLRDVDETVLRRQFSAKVGGARALAEVIASLPARRAPRWCAVFSSTSALLGGIAFGGYAAANAALTAVALGAGPAEGEGTRWTSAAWDTWSATLARLDGRRGASMAAHSMTDADALAAFDRAVGGPRPSVVVVAGGLDDRLPGAAAPAGQDTAGRHGGGNQPRPDLPQPFVPPITATERLLAGLWTEVLGVEPVGTRDNFFDLGGNSLLGLQMLANVKKRAGIVLPSVALFEAPTVHALARMLDERGGARIPAAPGATAARPASVAPVAALPAQRTARPSRPADQHSEDDRRIAIVGMAGRFPGAGDISAFWRNLCGGVESIRFFTEQELLDAGVSPELVRDPAYVPARPVLDDVGSFDAGFFGLSPRMAALTDPQQRLFLEVCWEALEQSGYCVPEHRGRVGVYGGANISTYLLGLSEQVMSDDDISSYEIIMGNDKDALTTTVSYLFDLYGPSVAVQTFCSTSLVATHLAVQSLRSGECELALAGGVSVRVPDRVGHVYTAGGQESPDGHVRAFDAQARGSMFGDGAAVVVLKRLSDALRDGDHVWGVIRGSAMNNDGALKAGYTAPSVVGQSRVIADAMADAGVTAEDIGYIEAHGTGTVLGDPIEVAALTRAFGPTERRQYCPIGSVKPNVGHLDRAAGVTGLIKTALALSERVIPPTLHYTAPNPEIDFVNSPFYVNALLSPWPAPEGRARTAGLNSLGMGGTNVHVVVEEPPDRPAPPAGDPVTSRRYHVLPVSGATETAADEACGRLAEHLSERPGGRLSDVAFTLQVGRKTFEHRRAAVAASTAEAAAVLSGGAGAPALMSRVEAARGRPTTFHFGSRDGGCPAGLGELYRREPVFQAALDDMIDALGEALAGAADRTSLEALLTADIRALLCGSGTPAPHDPAVARVLWTVVDLAFVATLAAWGVRPAAVSGSGTGRVTAACAGGGLTARDALALAVRSEPDDTADTPAVADPDAVLVLFGAAPAGPNPLTTAVLPGPGDPRPSDAVLTTGLADLWLAGVDVDWPAYHGRRVGEAPEDPAAPGRIPLPTYPFQRRRYWIDRQAPTVAAAVAAEPTCLKDIDDLPLLPEEQWLSQPVWRQTAAAAPGPDQPASWLVFADGGAGEGVLAGLRAAAENAGAIVTAVRPGAGFRQHPEGYTVRPGSIEDVLALLSALDDTGTGLDRVVHLWNLGVETGDERAALTRGTHTLVALGRAAGELGLGGWELDIVAPGAHAVLGGGEVRPEAATLIGPALVIPLEYPSVTTRLIDVEAGTRPADVLAELRRERTEPIVALRGTRRYVRGYEVLPPAAPERTAAVLRENGVYLITGGLGGIGLAMASRLARDARARLVLLGRTGLPPRERWSAIASGAEPADGITRGRVAQVLELLALGAQVEIVVGDVAEPDDVRRAVDLARERFGALHGVLHTAGVPGIGLIQFKQPQDCDVVLAPKVDGVRALAAALRFGEPDEAELDFLALFSSITSVTGGGPGQVDYCAGNAYLDAQAARLAADGRRVVSICWGEWTWNAWQEGLSGYDDDLQSFFRQHRERFGIGFEEGWRTLLRALAAGEPGVVVSTQDLPTIARYSGLFNIDAVTAPATAGAQGPRYPRPELLTPYREPQDPAQQRIASAWCETLKLERVGVDDNFFELGGNSLLGIPLLAELRSAYPGAKLPPHILYEAPTVATLARIVDGPVAVGAPAGPESAGSGVRAQASLRRSGVQAAAARRRRA